VSFAQLEHRWRCIDGRGTQPKFGKRTAPVDRRIARHGLAIVLIVNLHFGFPFLRMLGRSESRRPLLNTG
jgi:hypothetical protein